MQGMPISVDLAQAVLSNVLYSPRKRAVTPERIAMAVSDYYDVDIEALRGQKRDRAIVVPRQIAMYLMREETDVSLLRIGAELGGRDHSTVLHACRQDRPRDRTRTRSCAGSCRPSASSSTPTASSRPPAVRRPARVRAPTSIIFVTCRGAWRAARERRRAGG